MGNKCTTNPPILTNQNLVVNVAIKGSEGMQFDRYSDEIKELISRYYPLSVFEQTIFKENNRTFQVMVNGEHVIETNFTFGRLNDSNQFIQNVRHVVEGK